ncbi:MAG: ABC transporter ATP-binding protein [Candidatus Hodarchaeota archaeon]
MNANETAPSLNKISKMSEKLVLILSLVMCTFFFLELFKVVQSAFGYILSTPFDTFFSAIYLFIGFYGLMGIFTNSRGSTLLLILASFVGLVVQALGLLFVPSEINVFLPTLLLQIVFFGVVILGSGVVLSREILSQFQVDLDSVSDSIPAVEVRNLTKVYDLGLVKVHALRGVSFRIERGEAVAIMGPSGCGKSTLLNLIGALDRQTQGQILIDGVNIAQLDDGELAYLRNKKMGFIFQSYNLISRMSVIQNIEVPALVANVDSRHRRERAIELLTKIGLEDEIYRKPKTLSGGQQQRVAIARALQNKPSIILCDEPTGNLDSTAGDKIMEILNELRRDYGVTIMLVTHDPQIAAQADRVINLKDGVVDGIKQNNMVNT